MRPFRQFAILSALLVMIMASPLRAQLTELAFYRLGEDDGVSAGEEVQETIEQLEEFVNMTSFGTVTYSDDTPPGIDSTLSVYFDGEPDNYLWTDATAWQNNFPGFRTGMEAWIKVDPAAEGQEMVPFGNGTGYFLSIDADGFFHANGFSQTPASVDPVRYGEWQHVAFWTTGSFWQVYVDGVPQYDPAIEFNYGSPSGLATLGADRDGFSNYMGLIDEHRVFTWTGPFNPADLLYFSQRKAGDVNEDGVVDQVDYDTWRANVGVDLGDLSLLEGRQLGDLNGDRQIDLDDFGLIKSNKSPGALLVVPEPAACSLLLLGLGLVACQRSRRR